MAQRAAPPRLTLPPLRASYSARYPFFTPTATKTPFFRSPTPTPSKRPRAPEGPLWVLTLLELLSSYAVYKWLTGFGSSPPLVVFTFFALFGSSFVLVVAHRSWKGRPVISLQWGVLVGSGAILALSFLLRFQGLIACGPLESISADFSGALAGKILLEFSNKNSAPNKARKARGLVALLLAVFLLSQGWARASCSPLSFVVGYRTRLRTNNELRKDCVKVFSIFAPTLAGILSAFQRSMATRSPLRIIGRKRVHVLSHAIAAFILFPFSVMQIALMFGQGNWEFGRSAIWPLFSTVAFGMVLAFYSNFYSEEKLLTPAYSLKTFSIVTCCIVVLELLYGLDISLAGFLFCVCLLGFGVRELNLAPGELSWEALGDEDSSSFAFSSWVKSPLRHILQDKKSRKIAIFLLINTAFMFVEFFFGFLSNSLGLISDACHMLFDCAALVIGLYASYISRLPANSKFIYGYGRFEIISGYANAVFLVLVASLIVLESFERILEPQEITTESLLLVSVGGLLVNLIGLIFFHEEHHHAHGSGSCSHSDFLHVADKPADDTFCFSSTKMTCQSADSCLKTCSLDQHCAEHIHDDGNYSSYQIHLGNKVDTDSHKRSCNEHGHNDSSHRHGESVAFSDNNGAQDPNAIARKLALENYTSPLGSHMHHLYENEQASKHLTSDTASHAHTGGIEVDNNSGSSESSNQHLCSNNEGGVEMDHQADLIRLHEPDHYGKAEQDADPIRHQLYGSNTQEQDEHHENFSSKECHLKSDSENNGVLCSNNHHFHADEGPAEHSNHGDLHRDRHDHHYHHSHLSLHDGTSVTHHVSGLHHDHGHYHMDHNMQGIFLHVLADTLGSVGVVVSTFLIKYKGWLFMDPACSIFISGLIISSVIPLLRNSAEMLLQRVPRFNEQDLRHALKDIEKIPGVLSCQRLHTWSFTNKDIIGSLHLQVSSGSDKLAIQRTVLHLLHDAGVVDLTLEVEYM